MGLRVRKVSEWNLNTWTWWRGATEWSRMWQSCKRETIQRGVSTHQEATQLFRKAARLKGSQLTPAATSPSRLIRWGLNPVVSKTYKCRTHAVILVPVKNVEENAVHRNPRCDICLLHNMVAVDIKDIRALPLDAVSLFAHTVTSVLLLVASPLCLGCMCGEWP